MQRSLSPISGKRLNSTQKNGLFLQITSDFGELGESGLEVFNDFGGDDVGIGV
jgi:hypothetical protein